MIPKIKKMLECVACFYYREKISNFCLKKFLLMILYEFKIKGFH